MLNEKVDMLMQRLSDCAPSGDAQLLARRSPTGCLQEWQSQAGLIHVNAQESEADAADAHNGHSKSNTYSAASPVTPSGSLQEWRSKFGCAEATASWTTRSRRVNKREAGSEESDPESEPPTSDVDWSSRPSAPARGRDAKFGIEGNAQSHSDLPVQTEKETPLAKTCQDSETTQLIGCKLGAHGDQLSAQEMNEGASRLDLYSHASDGEARDISCTLPSNLKLSLEPADVSTEAEQRPSDARESFVHDHATAFALQLGSCSTSLTSPRNIFDELLHDG